MRRLMKILLIGAGGLLVLCVLVAVVTSRGGGGSSPTPTPAQAQRAATQAPAEATATAPAAVRATEASAPAAQPTTGAPAAQPAATPTLPWGTSKEDVHATLAEGQTAELVDGKDVYRLTLERIVDGAVSTNQFQRPKEGNRYLLFSIVIENAGTRAHLITAANFQLRTTAGFDYDPVFAPVGFEEGEAFSQEIGPGGKARGIVVFEIPEGNNRCSSSSTPTRSPRPSSTSMHRTRSNSSSPVLSVRLPRHNRKGHRATRLARAGERARTTVMSRSRRGRAVRSLTGSRSTE